YSGKWQKIDDTQGFVPLFNGKDLTGWRPANSQAVNWSVVNGVLEGRGRGPEGNGNFAQLITDGATYQDFHLRAELMLGEPQSAVLRYRVGPEGDDASVFGKGYGIHIEGSDLGRPDAVKLRTGTIRKPGINAKSDIILGQPNEHLAKVNPLAGKWFT